MPKTIIELDTLTEELEETFLVPVDTGGQSFKATLAQIRNFVNSPEITDVDDDYSVLPADRVLAVDATAEAIDLEIPEADDALNRVLLITKTDNSANFVVVDDGVGFEFTLKNQGEVLQIIGTATGWKILNHFDPVGNKAFGTDSGAYTNATNAYTTISTVTLIPKSRRPLEFTVQPLGEDSDPSYIEATTQGIFRLIDDAGGLGELGVVRSSSIGKQGYGYSWIVDVNDPGVSRTYSFQSRNGGSGTVTANRMRLVVREV